MEQQHTANTTTETKETAVAISHVAHLKEQKKNHHNRKQRRQLCQECQKSVALYQCPRCHFFSCSLTCCRAHKERTKCNGKRDRTAFRSMRDMNDDTLLSDYHFLEDVLESVESGKRLFQQQPGKKTTANAKRPRHHGPRNDLTAADTEVASSAHTLLNIVSLNAAKAEPTAPPPSSVRALLPVQSQHHPVHTNNNKNNNNTSSAVSWKWRRFQEMALQKSGVQVLFMPSGMQRRETNRSAVVVRSSSSSETNHYGDESVPSLQWTLELQWYPSQNRLPKDPTFAEKQTLTSAAKTVRAAPSTGNHNSNNNITKTVQFVSEDANLLEVIANALPVESSSHFTQHYAILLKQLPCPSHRPRYRQLVAPPASASQEENMTASKEESTTTNVTSNDATDEESSIGILTLAHALRDTTVIEYPTLYVVALDRLDEFPQWIAPPTTTVPSQRSQTDVPAALTTE